MDETKMKELIAVREKLKYILIKSWDAFLTIDKLIEDSKSTVSGQTKTK